MGSSFMGLYVQREALNIAQKALDVTGNNISNINTAGYTRQRVDIVSVANSKGTLGYNTGISLAGQGSEAVGVAQIRDRMLDKRVRIYSGDLCDVGIKVNTLSSVEDVFDSIEADDQNASFAYIISNFKSALQSFSADNADRSEMANVAVNAAGSLVQCVVTYDDKLDDINEQTLEDADKTVDRINEMLAEMGYLNKQIKSSYVSMGYLTPTLMNYEVMNSYGPLELKDSMNSLLDELGQYGNIEFQEEIDGTFTVKFAGQTVVSDKYYAQMAITSIDPEPTELEYEISSNLLEKEDWYDLHVKYATGGDAQVLLQMDTEELDTVNITGTDPQGDQYLDSGSMRGYLDVYNGRGIYAHEEKYTQDSINNAQEYIDEANDILAKIKAGTASEEDKDRLGYLIGSETADDGTVTLNGTALNGSKSVTLTGSGAYLDSGAVTISGSAVKNTEKLDEANSIIRTIGTADADADKIKSLEELIGATVTTDPNTGEVVSVRTANGTLLDGTKTIQKDTDGSYFLGEKITVNGKAGSKYVDISNSYKGVEYYRDMLNAFVRTATNEFNGIFADVTDKDGNNMNISLFTYEDSDGVTDFRTAAENFRVTDMWQKNPEIIANPSGENEFYELDNEYINKMLAVFTVELDYGDGTVTDPQHPGLEKYVSHICDDLGSKVSEEQSLYDATDVMLTSVETSRSEKMDVSLNEEGINMINYQKWYNAISRMITTMDEALDKLINGTGVVGLR